MERKITKITTVVVTSAYGPNTGTADVVCNSRQGVCGKLSLGTCANSPHLLSDGEKLLPVENSGVGFVIRGGSSPGIITNLRCMGGNPRLVRHLTFEKR